jgi:hypothetical protein
MARKKLYRRPPVKESTTLLLTVNRETMRNIREEFPQDVIIQQKVKAYDAQGCFTLLGAAIDLGTRTLALQVFEGYHRPESPVLVWGKTKAGVRQIPHQQVKRMVEEMHHRSLKNPPKRTIPKSKASLLKSIPGLTTGTALEASREK